MKERAKNKTYDPNPGFKVEIEDLYTNTKIIYKSMQEAARSLDSYPSTYGRRGDFSYTLRKKKVESFVVLRRRKNLTF